MTKSNFVRLLILTLAGLIFFHPTSANDFVYLKIQWNKYAEINNFAFLNESFHVNQLTALNSSLSTTSSGILTFRKAGEQLLAFRDCSFDKFVWDGVTWKNLYLYQEYGMNCSSEFFFKDGKCYSLGSFGFWKKHTDLIQFDDNFGTWELVEVFNQPKNFGSEHISILEHGVVVLSDQDIVASLDLIKQNNVGYYLNWDTKVWHPLRFHWNEVLSSSLEKIVPKASVDLKDYFVFVMENRKKVNGWYILDKKTLKIMHYNAHNFHFNDSPYLQVTGNILHYLSANQIPHQIDLHEISNKGIIVGELILSDDAITNRKKDKKSMIYLWWGLVLCIVFVVAVFYVRGKMIKRKNSSFSIQDDKLAEIILKLQYQKGKTLSSQSLDEVFSIDRLKNQDVKRVTRSNLINEINTVMRLQEGNDLIIRLRADDDRRFVYYLIKK